MLAYLLAIIVAIGSFTFYIAAFFVPEMHRRQDFLWSGLGMFYAVVLWFCAGRLTGAVLLGQVVSVALLGGLGWHTLALRRDLTPEPVQTPVDWDDLRQWVQQLQTQLGQVLPWGTAVSRVKALGAAISQALTQIGDRATDSRAAAPSAEVPPLQRSPAYEFETATGAGQTVPSEFATVPRRQQPRPKPASRTRNGELAETPSSAEAETTAAADQAASTDKVDFSAESTVAAPPPTAPESLATAAASPPTPSATPISAAPQNHEAATTAQPAAKQRRNPVTGLLDWLTDTVKGSRQPKPQRSVIEIPPRAPSISRSPDTDSPDQERPATATPQQQPSDRRTVKAARAVIDIPPRPPSIPRAPAATQPERPPSPPAGQSETNWVDVGDRPPKAQTPTPPPPPFPQDSEKPATTAANPETNWQDVETNWPDESNRTVSTPPEAEPDNPPPGATQETNWPDEEDTNWPD